MNMKKHKIITFFVSFLIPKIFCNSPLEANTVFTAGESIFWKLSTSKTL